MNSKKNTVPNTVVKRLPRYYRYLDDLLSNNVTRISSAKLSKLMGVTASQIRQDFNNFGGFGQQGYGYNVKFLHDEIGKILGTDRNFTLIIIGGGNLGRAISNYANLKKRGYNVVAIFDTDHEKVGKEYNGIKVYAMSTLEEFAQNNSPDIAVLTLPKEKVAETVNRLEKINIKGIWNFSYSDFKPSGNIPVENVHLSDSLMRLSYKITDISDK